MTHIEAMAAIAQGVINIDAGLTTIEKDSRVYRGMSTIAGLHEIQTTDRLHTALECINGEKRPTKAQIDRAVRILDAMVKERTDPDFEE